MQRSDIFGLYFRIIVILYGIAGGPLETGQQHRREKAARPDMEVSKAN